MRRLGEPKQTESTGRAVVGTGYAGAGRRKVRLVFFVRHPRRVVAVLQIALALHRPQRAGADRYRAQTAAAAWKKG